MFDAKIFEQHESISQRSFQKHKKLDNENLVTLFSVLGLSCRVYNLHTLKCFPKLHLHILDYLKITDS